MMNLFSSRSPATKLLLMIMLQFIAIHETMASKSYHIDPLTRGFHSIPLNKSNLVLQRPYNVPENERYSFIDGVQKLWVLKSDKPHSPTSRTSPRTEIRIHGYDYSSDVWQFEGYFYVPHGTKGVSIMQVFGAAKHATTLMLIVNENGALTYYRTNIVIVPHVYDKWFKLNVIHDVEKTRVRVYINDRLKYEAPGRGGKSHYFKYGVYSNRDASSCMESRWKKVGIFRK
ncbi:hypothetical protein LIER_11259 [Lithospermum erythrorhizon]|uniref:Alginate lyase 2 domain-containing protein n=1 Tax=Lithospermum erythrorhizon TaxID=34254 RepID=A0AAV3PMF0_LITER